jgi:hypothetical protein
MNPFLSPSLKRGEVTNNVMPAEAGIQNMDIPWIPAYAGMTVKGWIPIFATCP